MDNMPGRFPPPPESDGDQGLPRPPGYPPGGGMPGSFYPLSVDRVMQLTFSMLRFRWRTFLAISLGVMGPLAIGSALLEIATVESMGRWMGQLVDVQFYENDPSAILSLFPWPAIAGTVLGSIAIGLLSSLAVAGLAHATAVTLGGGQPSAMGSLAAAFGALGRLAILYGIIFLAILAITLVGAFIVGLLFLASFIGGSLQPGPLVFGGLILLVALVVVIVFITVRLVFSVAIVVIEGGSALQSVRRSWRLARGATWRVLGYILLFGLVAGLPVALISGIASAVIGPAYSGTGLGLTYNSTRIVAESLITSLVAAAFAPISTIAVTLLYFDLRWRNGEPVPAPGGGVSTRTDAPWGAG
jgi:glycerophosphoryl diester phosphodiesterase family protein